MHRDNIKVLHSDWLPVLELAIRGAQRSRAMCKMMGMPDKSNCWVNYLIMWRLFKAYTLCEKQVRVDESEEENAFIDLWKNHASRRDYRLEEEDVPLIMYGVASTFVVGMGYEVVVNEKIFSILVEDHSLLLSRSHLEKLAIEEPGYLHLPAKDPSLIDFAFAFANELHALRPSPNANNSMKLSPIDDVLKEMRVRFFDSIDIFERVINEGDVT